MTTQFDHLSFKILAIILRGWQFGVICCENTLSFIFSKSITCNWKQHLLLQQGQVGSFCWCPHDTHYFIKQLVWNTCEHDKWHRFFAAIFSWQIEQSKFGSHSFLSNKNVDCFSAHLNVIFCKIELNDSTVCVYNSIYIYSIYILLGHLGSLSTFAGK